MFFLMINKRFLLAGGIVALLASAVVLWFVLQRPFTVLALGLNQAQSQALTLMIQTWKAENPGKSVTTIGRGVRDRPAGI